MATETGIGRIGWMPLFTQLRKANNFLTSFFTFKPGNIYDGEKVAIDIERYGEDVAVVVKKCSGPNLNDIDEFTTKEFIPPAYSEAAAIDVCELLNRRAGVDPYSAAYDGYTGSLIGKLAKAFSLMENKIKRAIEIQASQILQTGTLTLTNKSGDTVYELDFAPKTTHFPTSSVIWSSASSTKIEDLEALAEQIRADGQLDPNVIIMGRKALSYFLDDDQVQNRLDNRRINIGNIMPTLLNSGATSHGQITLGDYDFQIISYKGTYKDPATSTVTKYLDDGNVIMMRAGEDGTRLDITSARVVLPLGPDPRVEGLLPERMSNEDMGFDVTPNIYPSANGKQIMGELESRPLLIPVQIDGFGCLDTGV